MKDKLRILHLEDMPGDAALVERVILKSGLAFEILLACDKNEFRKGLSEFHPNIILCDHSLPDIDSREALRLTREQEISVPFILVTSTVSEEYAVEIMREGAYDYILKDRLQRLPTAIKNAMDKWVIEKEKEKYMERVVANEARFRALLENITDGVVIHDKTGVLLYQSPSVSRILGYSHSERIGLLQRTFIHPDYQSSYDAFQCQLAEQPGIPLNFEYPFRHKNGNYVWLEGVVTNLEREPHVGAYVVNYRDITERKRTEETLKKSESNLRAIFESTTDGFVLLNTEYQLVDFNDASRKLMMRPKSEKEMRGQLIFNLIPEQRHEVFKGYLLRAATGEVVEYDVHYDFGEITKWLHATLQSVTSQQQQLLGYCLTLRDFTDQKKAELAVRANEERFRALAEHSDDIIAIIDMQGKFRYLSPGVIRFLGYNLEELNGLNDLDKYELVHEEDQSTCRTLVEQLVEKTDYLLPIALRVRNKSGQWRSLEGTGKNLANLSSVGGVVVNVRDVTEKKLLQEHLDEKKYFLERAQKVGHIGYWISDAFDENASLIWSEETCRIFGLQENEFDSRLKTFVDFIHPEDRDNVLRLAQETVVKGIPFSIDHRIVLRNGAIRWVHEQAEITKDRQGQAQKFIGIVQDITDRKLIEDVLRQYNDRYELLTKATNEAIWDWDVKLGTIIWNHGVTTNFGYEEEDIEFIFRWWKDRIHPDDRENVTRSMASVFISRNNTWSCSYRFQCADKRYKNVLDRAYILYENSEPVRVIGSMQDISERVKASEEIEKLSFVASRTDNAVMITDAAQRIEWVNESFVRMTGYALSEVKGRKSGFLRGPETNETMVKWMNEKLANHQPFSGELINYSKTGNKYWVKLEIVPVFSDSGKIKNFISIQSDITEQKHFENRIMAIAREFSSLIANANVPIFGIDRNGYINEWNKVAEQVFGASKSEVLGKKLIDELGGHERQAIEQMVLQVLRGNSISNFELTVVTKTKKRLILFLSASPRMGLENETQGAIVVAQDVTELIEYRKNLERIVHDRTRALNEALLKEKELVDMKSKFVSIASHEFRTPLSTIVLASGFIQKFKDKLSPEAIDEKLSNIEKQVEHMTRLLDDVLMIGKAEAGKIPVRLSTINIQDFFQKMSLEIEHSTRRSHRINTVFQLSIPVMRCDEKLLRNIVINILTNAIKFSPNAKEVDFILQTDNAMLSMIFRDYGIGIPEEDMKQIFEPFYRGRNVDMIQGTGLGLSIIKKAVNLLNGYIDVKSAVGKGTQLTVTLPLNHE